MFVQIFQSQTFRNWVLPETISFTWPSSPSAYKATSDDTKALSRRRQSATRSRVKGGGAGEPFQLVVWSVEFSKYFAANIRKYVWDRRKRAVLVVVVGDLKMRNKKKWEICIAEVTFRMGGGD